MNIRKRSGIINIRTFHNFIKRTLIEEAVDFIQSNYNIKNIALLDLAVGKGGDINKWADNKIYKVVGFDINKDSVYGSDGAIERFNKIKNKIGAGYDYKFYVTDLSKNENLKFINEKINESKINKFNIVSCQFAIHYFFEKEEYLENLLSIVSTYLDRDGFFIGTTMDGDKIYQQIMKKGDIIENDTYYIENKTDLTATNQPFGNTYLVRLGQESSSDKHYFSDKASKEYMVNIDTLKRICAKYNLMYIGTTGFKKWYDIYSNNTLTENEKEFSFLNFSFVFQKK